MCARACVCVCVRERERETPIKFPLFKKYGCDADLFSWGMQMKIYSLSAAANMRNWMWVAVMIMWSCSCSILVMSMGAAAGAQQQLEAAEAVRYWQTRLAGARMPSGVRAMVSPLSSHEASQLLLNIQHYLPTHAEAFCVAAHIRCPHEYIQRRPAHSHELEKDQSKRDPTSSPQKPPLGHEHSHVTRSRRLGGSNDVDPQTNQRLPPFQQYSEHGKGRFEGGSVQIMRTSTVPVEKPTTSSDPQNLLLFYYDQPENINGSQRARPRPLEKPDLASDPQNLLLFYYEHEKEGSPSGARGSQIRAKPLKKLTAADPQNLQLFFDEHQIKEGYRPQTAAEADLKKPSTASDPQNLLLFYYEHDQEDSQGSQSAQPLKKLTAADPQNLLLFYYEDDQKEGYRSQRAAEADLKDPSTASDPQNLLLFYYEHDKEDSQSSTKGSQSAQPLKKLTAADPQNLLLFYYEHDQKEVGSQRAAEADPSTASDPQNLLLFYYEQEDSQSSTKGSQSAKPLKKLTAADPQNLLLFYYEHDQKEGYRSQRAAEADLKKPSAASDPQNLLLFYYEHDSQSSTAGSQSAKPLKKLTGAADPQNLLLFYYEHPKEGYRSLRRAEAAPTKKQSTFDPQNLLLFYYESKKEQGFEPGSAPGLIKEETTTHADPQNLLLFYYEQEKGGSQISAERLIRTPSTSDPQNLLLFYYEHEKDGLEGSRRSGSTTHKKQDGLRRVFFREQQVLVRGVDIHVNFAYGVDEMPEERAFLPRKLAKLFPLAAGRGPEIARRLGLLDADLQDTIELCTSNIDMNTDVDVRRCLSSIEDVADFVRSVMGDNYIDVYDAVANASAAELVNAGKTFHVVDVKMLKAGLDEPAVACHDMAFPFRVFFCHYVKQTMIFQATLRSAEDGSVHQRIAVCHYDTSYWGAWHMSFAELNTKPGESEACHWLGAGWLHQKGWVFVRAGAAGTARTA